MEKKFICQQCGKEFMADTNNYVTCPVCDSDNVTIVKKKSPIMMIAIIAAAVVVTVSGALVVWKLSSRGSDTGQEDVFVPVDTVAAVVEENLDTVPAGYELPAEISFKRVGTPEFDKASGSYSLIVTANIPEGYKGKYTLLDIDGKNIIISNESGIFLSVKPLAASKNNPEAAYRVKVEAIGTPALEPIETTVGGFVEIKKSSGPLLTAADVQRMLDKSDLSGLSDKTRFAQPVKVVCTRTLAGEPAPTSLSQILDHIMMGVWNGVTVNSVGTDDTGRVNVVTVTPK